MAAATAGAVLVRLEAVELAQAEAPGPATHAVPVGVDAGAEVAVAEALGVEERHGDTGGERISDWLVGWREAW